MRQRPELIVSGAWYALVREPRGTNARFSSKLQSQCGCRMLADLSFLVRRLSPPQFATHAPTWIIFGWPANRTVFGRVGGKTPSCHRIRATSS